MTNVAFILPKLNNIVWICLSIAGCESKFISKLARNYFFLNAHACQHVHKAHLLYAVIELLKSIHARVIVLESKVLPFICIICG